MTHICNLYKADILPLLDFFFFANLLFIRDNLLLHMQQKVVMGQGCLNGRS